MEIKPTTLEEITWDMEGSGHFEVDLENGVIKRLKMCEHGSDESKCLHSTNEKHLRNLQKALTSLFNHIDAKHTQSANVPGARHGETPASSESVPNS